VQTAEVLFVGVGSPMMSGWWGQTVASQSKALEAIAKYDRCKKPFATKKFCNIHKFAYTFSKICSGNTPNPLVGVNFAT